MSGKTPSVYKDYVNFLQGYKTLPKKGDEIDGAPLEKHYPVNGSNNNYSPKAPTTFAVDHHMKNHFEEHKHEMNNKTVKSEIFIEINNQSSSVREATKIFEPSISHNNNNNAKTTIVSEEKNVKYVSKLIKELEHNDVTNNSAPMNKSPKKIINNVKYNSKNNNYKSPVVNFVQKEEVPPEEPKELEKTNVNISEITKIFQEQNSAATGTKTSPNRTANKIAVQKIFTETPAGKTPPPILRVASKLPSRSTIEDLNTKFIENEKLQHTDFNKIVNKSTSPSGTTVVVVDHLNKGTLTNGAVNQEIDRNNPVVKKIVYGALREMYGNYHEKANNYVGTLPKHMVKKSNGVQDIIDNIASQGGLEKLSGRANPDVEKI